MGKIVDHSYTSLISLTNLFQAWEEFKCGKRNKRDVQVFERNLEDYLFDLHRKLKNKTYTHGTYQEFWVNDPKRRHIHKACVADRVVHHLLYKYLYALFDKSFIHDSYSCRLSKGTHRSVKRLEKYARIVSKNYIQDCWALKLDVKQFFASVDHEILKELIRKRVTDLDILWLLDGVIDSFETEAKTDCFALLAMTHLRAKGIPLGNLTSQIFANIYLNELDQFIKHDLKIKYYIRYADDFLVLNAEKLALKPNLISIGNFLKDNLKLQLHPKKIVLTRLTRGIDFCGYVVLPHFILPRTKTKRRILNNVTRKEISNESLQSYLGYFSHASCYKVSQDLKDYFWFQSEA